MIVTIMQPAYLPWLGYFDRIAMSDLFVVLDHVKIDRNSKTKFANRNRVRTPQGWCWLTVPIKTKACNHDLLLHRLEVTDDQRWAQKHWKTIIQNYSGAPFFAKYSLFFDELYRNPPLTLVQITQRILAYLLQALNIGTPVAHSSGMKLEGAGSDLVLEICRKFNATRYISGPFGRTYLNEETFAEAGIEIIYHDYEHPVYTQAFPGWEPYMSVIDLLFNHGKKSLKIIRGGQNIG